jgi:galactokinase
LAVHLSLAEESSNPGGNCDISVRAAAILAWGRYMNTVQDLTNKFRAKFGTSPTICRAPGRVNLIGEHTDYNDGFVLPAAIEFSCWTAAAARKDRKITVYSENLGQSVIADLDDLKPLPETAWANYPLGVARALEQAGSRLSGAELYFAGEVPLGSGLSSSAAIEVSTGLALLKISGLPIDRTALALLCQRAENEFVGARCGIMDQFISCHGSADRALLLDCRSLEFRMIPIPADVTLAICNTMVRHELGASGYNARRAECEQAGRLLAQMLPGIRALRDVTQAQLEEHSNLLSTNLYRRARHVITENARVVAAAHAFESGAIEKLRQLMAESHRSLRDDYEVSCPELDNMVEIAARQRGVLGARMTGGGFGGCTINLVETEHAEEFQRRISVEYANKMGLQADVYLCKASQGAEVVGDDSAIAGNGPVSKAKSGNL